ncbi:hypothetical protein [Streptomyces sp. G-G2]|nr:hypothetical protein [Streptomyces sp. G-G2]MDJ0386157.1 hypothetical protein [Streptomyces sp. G-G2]
MAAHADFSLISTVQSLRLIAMVLLAPLLLRLAAPPPSRGGR